MFSLISCSVLFNLGLQILSFQFQTNFLFKTKVHKCLCLLFCRVAHNARYACCSPIRWAEYEREEMKTTLQNYLHCSHKIWMKQWPFFFPIPLKSWEPCLWIDKPDSILAQNEGARVWTTTDSCKWRQMFRFLQLQVDASRERTQTSIRGSGWSITPFLYIWG